MVLALPGMSGFVAELMVFVGFPQRCLQPHVQADSGLLDGSWCHPNSTVPALDAAEIFYGAENKELRTKPCGCGTARGIYHCLSVGANYGIGLYPKMLTQIYDSTTVQQRLRDSVPTLARLTQQAPTVSFRAPEIGASSDH